MVAGVAIGMLALATLSWTSSLTREPNQLDCENQSLAKELNDYGEEFAPQFPVGTSRSSLLDRAERSNMSCFTICSDGSAKSSCQPKPEEWTGTRCRLTRKTKACSHTLWVTGTFIDDTLTEPLASKVKTRKLGFLEARTD